MKVNLTDIISDLSKEKGIDRDTIIKCIEDAVTAAAYKKLVDYNTLESHYNHKTGEVELFQYRVVAENIIDSDNQISLEEALEMDDSAEIGDEVEYEVSKKEFDSIAQSARQLMFQKIKQAEKEMVYEHFKDRVNEVLTGVVVRTESDGRVAISFNRVEAYLYRKEQIPGERFESGDHVRVYLMGVSDDIRKSSQLAISRTHPGLLMKLFEMEVPEVYDGLIEVVNASREPGKRAKISVFANDDDIDPVGSCVGVKGSRVQAIVTELRGEKVDIVKWDENIITYIQNALAPAKIDKMEINEEDRKVTVWVEPDQLSLAIGRQGQNVRLASKLTGFNIDVNASEQKKLSIEEQLAMELGKSNNDRLREDADADAEVDTEAEDKVESEGNIEDSKNDSDNISNQSQPEEKV